MHDSSFNEMRRALVRYLGDRFEEHLWVLDIGSRCVRGQPTYREIMPPAWLYMGSDIVPGPNVDMVQPAPYRIQILSAQYDLVISGQCLEHVEHPWLWMAEAARMLRPGGWCIVTAPWRWPVYRYPVDCWRILPDGLWALFESAGLAPVKTYIRRHDCWGIARKPV